MYVYIISEYLCAPYKTIEKIITAVFLLSFIFSFTIRWCFDDFIHFFHYIYIRVLLFLQTENRIKKIQVFLRQRIKRIFNFYQYIMKNFFYWIN